MNPPNWENYQERLTSFNHSNWPRDSPMYIKELVEAGFVYTGEKDLVFCFRCGVSTSEWKDGDDAIRVHKLLNSNCPFLKTHTNSFDNKGHLKSLQDYERESLIFDWHLDSYSVIQRSPRNIPPTTLITTQNRSEKLPCESYALPANDDDDKRRTYAPTSPNRQLFKSSSRSPQTDMSSEAERFQSFAICPVNKHWPPPETLAAAGFYCVDDQGTMRCFACNLQVKSWDSSDQDPMIRHRSLSPSCPIVPRKDQQPDIDVSHVTTYMNDLMPSDPNQNSMIENEDVAQPTYERYHSDPPYEKRQLRYSYTPTNPREIFSSGGQLPHRISFDPRAPCWRQPVMSFQQPVHRFRMPAPNTGLSDYDVRLNTFLTWPIYCPVQPDELAKAGFFYTGDKDGVRCYRCNISLFSWQKGETAWGEHAKHSPLCPLVIEWKRKTQGIKINYPPKPVNVVEQQSYIQGPEQRPYHSIGTCISDPQSLSFTVSPRYPIHRPQVRPNRFPRSANPLGRTVSNPDSYQRDGIYVTEPMASEVNRPFGVVPATSRMPASPRNNLPLSNADPIPCMSGRHFEEPRVKNIVLSPLDNTPLKPKTESEEDTVKMITQKDIDSVLDMGFSEELVSTTIRCYLQYSTRTFSEVGQLAQAVIYYQKYKTLEGSPFGNNLAKASEEGKRILEPRHSSNKSVDSSQEGVILCKVCMDNEVEIAFHPCGHLIVCTSCALDMKICPMCRLPIQGTLRTYLS